MISAIIPTKNRRACVDVLLGFIERQSLKPEEVIVVDSTKDPEWYSSASVPVVYYHKPAFSQAEAKWFGVNEAKGDIVVFLEDDMRIWDDYFEEIENAFRKYSRDGVTGINVIKSRHYFLLDLYLRIFLITSYDHSKNILFPSMGVGYGIPPCEAEWIGGPSAFKKWIIMANPPDLAMDSSGDHGEDTELSYKIYKNGGKLMVSDRVIYEHPYPLIRWKPTYKTNTRRYQFNKFFEPTLTNRLIFEWSEFGRRLLQWVRSL